MPWENNMHQDIAVNANRYSSFLPDDFFQLAHWLQMNASRGFSSVQQAVVILFASYMDRLYAGALQSAGGTTTDMQENRNSTPIQGAPVTCATAGLSNM